MRIGGRSADELLVLGTPDHKRVAEEGIGKASGFPDVHVWGKPKQARVVDRNSKLDKRHFVKVRRQPPTRLVVFD